MKVVALSWHPATTTETISGGYKRFSEIAKRTPINITIIDRYPTIYSRLSFDKINIKEYGKYLDPRFLKHLHLFIYDLLQRVFSVTLIFIRLCQERPDTLYVPDSELSHLTLPAIIYKLLFGSRVVLADLNVNTISPERLLNVYLHKFADRVITISLDLKKDLARTGIAATDVNGVGFEKPKVRGSVLKKFDAIFIGRHIPQKGIIDLLKIWSKVRKNLVLVGNVPDYIRSEINERIKELGLESYITRYEDVSEEKKIDLLQSSRVMVFPSHQEGWGIAPMEALSLGLPVIAYDLPVYRESIGKSMAFRTVPEGDISQFVNTTINTLSFLSKYSQSAKMWRPRQTWEKIAQKEWRIICS